MPCRTCKYSKPYREQRGYSKKKKPFTPPPQDLLECQFGPPVPLMGKYYAVDAIFVKWPVVDVNDECSKFEIGAVP